MTDTLLARRSFAALVFVTLLVSAPALAQRQAESTISTEKIFEAVGVREGATVCEIGAGDGELSIAAARLVGAQGRIHTSELGEERLQALRRKVTDSELAHINVVAGESVQTNFPDGACDALFMRNVYHHFSDPAAMNRSIWRAVAPGGRVAVVDFTPSGKEGEQPADRSRDGTHGVAPESVSRELKEAGFEPVSKEASDQRWFMVVVSKPRP